MSAPAKKKPKRYRHVCWILVDGKGWWTIADPSERGAVKAYVKIKGEKR